VSSLSNVRRSILPATGKRGDRIVVCLSVTTRQYKVSIKDCHERTMPKLSYLFKAITTQFSPERLRCPNCGNENNQVVDRKYFVTQLRRCGRCQLQYRTPTDNPANNMSFYETEYVQGFTTNLPADSELAKMKENGFAGGEKDYRYYISVLRNLGLEAEDKVLDYGCSWGYGSFQLREAGFNVVSFEIAPTRRRFAHEKLGVATVEDLESIPAESLDCFFSAHVLEHVPSPAQSIQHALRLLKRGGLFVSFTPNGSNAHKARSPDWHKLWGEVHPNFIDDVFLDSSFKSTPRIIGSSPVISAVLPDATKLIRLDDLDRGELFFAARKLGASWA